MIITEEPEFVFYKNFAKGLDILEKIAQNCFRKFTREEAKRINIGDQFYVDRNIYGDKRYHYLDQTDTQLLFGLMKVTALEKKEISPGRIILKYKTEGLEAETHMHFYLPEWQPHVYDSPYLIGINQLIATYGEAIIIPPTQKECSDYIRKLKK